MMALCIEFQTNSLKVSWCAREGKINQCAVQILCEMFLTFTCESLKVHLEEKFPLKCIDLGHKYFKLLMISEK